MPQPIMLLGAGGNLYDALDVIDAINNVTPAWQVLGVVDDYREQWSVYAGLTVLGPLRTARTHDCVCISTMWNEKVFKVAHEIFAANQLDQCQFATLVHPSSAVSSRARIGSNVIINVGASLAGNVRIADHVSIGPGCILGHDTMIESYSCLAAGAIVGGGVQISRNCYIGSGALVRQHINIGEKSLIGMGAVVVKDVPPCSTIVGNPGALLERKPCYVATRVTGD